MGGYFNSNTPSDSKDNILLTKRHSNGKTGDSPYGRGSRGRGPYQFSPGLQALYDNGHTGKNTKPDKIDVLFYNVKQNGYFKLNIQVNMINIFIINIDN